MTDQFSLFRKFDNERSLTELTEILKENKIPFEVENNTSHFDPSMAMTMPLELDLLVKQSDFERVNDLLSNGPKIEMEDLPKDYHLLSFSNEELKEVLFHRDQWGDFDLSLARQILMERNVELGETEIMEKREARLLELAKPEDPNFLWMAAGYFFALMGGVIGLLFGWYLMNSKKTLPNGTKIPRYSTSYQKHGFAMLVIGLCVVLFSFYLQLQNL